VLLGHRSPQRRLILILDNARDHHATLLRPFLTARRRVLSSAFLPPHSSDLTRLDAHAQAVYSQPILSAAHGPPSRRLGPTGSVEKNQCSTCQIVRHYLSRSV
jgi:hypothetical protein